MWTDADLQEQKILSEIATLITDIDNIKEQLMLFLTTDEFHSVPCAKLQKLHRNSIALSIRSGEIRDRVLMMAGKLAEKHTKSKWYLISGDPPRICD